ncbi:phosphatase PAP2 family protein [Streptomyces sp. NPDC059247]|uniref:phosphatase PAP2 family protein n=1 Tax=Streptomyces sp. NPDC059247 TaxID=3346790 RepID=UPI003686569A
MDRLITTAEPDVTDRRTPPVLLPPALRSTLGPAAVLAALVVLLLGVLYGDRGGPGTVDERIAAALDDLRPPWRTLALAVDFLGEPAGAAALIVAAVAGCLLLRRPRAAVFVVLGTGVPVVATTLLKHVVGRTINGGHLSYPSGHTAFLTALALVAGVLAAGRLGLGRAAGALLVLTGALLAGGAMGWAQVALDAHYPTDTVGGWCTALAAVPALARLTDRAADRRAARTAGTGRPAQP